MERSTRRSELIKRLNTENVVWEKYGKIFVNQYILSSILSRK
ncbi:MAG: hypothetical protein ACMUEL_07150 [Flavobacteriales bacterium Tduv]